MRSSGEATQALPEDPAVLRALLLAAWGERDAAATARDALAAERDSVVVERDARIYREFCVWGGTMLLKEPSHAATQTTCHPG
jgi:hypothetical protein